MSHTSLTHGSITWTLVRGVSSRRSLFCCQRAETTGYSELHRCGRVWNIPGSAAGTWRNPAALGKPREATTRVSARSSEGSNSQIQEPPQKGLTLTGATSRPADFFTTAALLRRSAALDVFQRPPVQQQFEEMQRMPPLTEKGPTRWSAICSIYCSMPRWTRNVSERPPKQVEP